MLSRGTFRYAFALVCTIAAWHATTTTATTKATTHVGPEHPPERQLSFTPNFHRDSFLSELVPWQPACYPPPCDKVNVKMEFIDPWRAIETGFWLMSEEYTPYFGEAVFFFNHQGNFLGVLDLIQNQTFLYNNNATGPPDRRPGPPTPGSYPGAILDPGEGWIVGLFETDASLLPWAGGIFGHLKAHQETGIAYFDYYYYDDTNPDDFNSDADIHKNDWLYWFYGDYGKEEDLLDYPYQFMCLNTSHYYLPPAFGAAAASSSLLLPSSSWTRVGVGFAGDDLTWGIQPSNLGFATPYVGLPTICAAEHSCLTPSMTEGMITMGDNGVVVPNGASHLFHMHRTNGRGKCQSECRPRLYNDDDDNLATEPALFGRLCDRVYGDRNYGEWKCGACP